MSGKTTVEKRTEPDNYSAFLVVLGGFIVQFMTGGLVHSLGPLYIDMKRYFGSSAEETSWIFSVASAVLFFTGILGAVNAKLFGHRLAVIVGGLLASSGFLISYFATNLNYLYGSIGVLVGAGLGMCVSPNLTMLAIYFPKKHSLVNGIAMVGSGVCIFVMPPLLQASIDKYGWRGSMLILSATCAHIVISGTLMRPLARNGAAKDKESDICQVPCETESNYATDEKDEEQTSKRICDYSHYLRVVFFTYVRFTLLVISFAFVVVGMFGGSVHMQARAKVQEVGSLQQNCLACFHGWIYDVTGNYDYSFYALGGFHLLGGFICIIGQCITWNRNRKLTEKDNATSQLDDQTIVNSVYDDLVMKDATRWIYDVTGNYDYSFYAMGGFHLLGAFICILGQCITWHRNKKLKGQDKSSSQVDDQAMVDPLQDEFVMKDATSQTFISDFVYGNNTNTNWILDSPSVSESLAVTLHLFISKVNPKDFDRFLKPRN
ncbi:monocarboxylate transporter 12-like [Ptychodera flava]|uniref:monocarboxylate transporter 12-like n=1 Tax=Ptychodera flava TaxID=63121 RepID=UPI003969C47C